MMTGLDDIDIEALLDAPLQQKQQQRSAVDSFISEAKHSSSSHRDYRDDRRDRHRSSRSRSRSRDRRRRDYHKDSRSYDDTRRESRRNDEPEVRPVLTESQRDRRTVFCRQLAQRCRSDDLRTFLETAGKVRDVKIVYDRISGRSKGVAYVEFAEEATVQKAIALSGQKVCGIPIIIEITETEKNRLAEEAAEAARRSKDSSTPSGSGTGRGSSGPVGVANINGITKVFVGNLHLRVEERDLRKIFEPFGDIDFVQMHSDQDASKSHAHIHFRNASDAGMAVDQMNGFDLAGRPIRVGILRDRPDGTNHVQYKVGELFSANLDDSETQGLSLSAKSRTELMMKLAREPVNIPGRPVGPSPCLLLAGMYNPEEETELHWEYAITDEVREECSKWGPIKHIHVAKTKDGEVWLQFTSIQASQTALNALNGRWFGGRQIQAKFIDPIEYQRRFPN